MQIIESRIEVLQEKLEQINADANVVCHSYNGLERNMGYKNCKSKECKSTRDHVRQIVSKAIRKMYCY